MKKVDWKLRAAVKERYFAEAKRLLAQGANANTVFFSKAYTLHDYFQFSNSYQMLKLLFNEGNLNVNYKDCHGHTLLEVAISRCDKKMFNFLLKTGKVDLHGKTSFGLSPLAMAVKGTRNCGYDKSFIINLLKAGATWSTDKTMMVDNLGAVDYADNLRKLASFLVRTATFIK